MRVVKLTMYVAMFLGIEGLIGRHLVAADHGKAHPACTYERLRLINQNKLSVANQQKSCLSDLELRPECSRWKDEKRWNLFRLIAIVSIAWISLLPLDIYVPSLYVFLSYTIPEPLAISTFHMLQHICAHTCVVAYHCVNASSSIILLHLLSRELHGVV